MSKQALGMIETRGLVAAIEAADIVLMDDNPAKIAGVVKIGRKTMAIAHQNIVFALAVKALVLIFGALGYAGMWRICGKPCLRTSVFPSLQF